ncbi:MAG: GFA family protein [Burkholderiales bacterium]|nr:GFA family protein [Burkholderiales bacterium]
MITGHCNCGSVSFDLEGAPEGVFICHCSICRRATGANGVAVVLVPNERFRWTQGKEHIAQWAKPDSQWETWFCRNCGSRLPGQNDAERMFIPAGLLPGNGLGLRVQAHIWVDSRAEWDEIGDHGQQYPEHYGTSGAQAHRREDLPRQAG